jgi:hypothetical protein
MIIVCAIVVLGYHNSQSVCVTMEALDSAVA